jgi:hypothetical protein
VIVVVVVVVVVVLVMLVVEAVAELDCFCQRKEVLLILVGYKENVRPVAVVAAVRVAAAADSPQDDDVDTRLAS